MEIPKQRLSYLLKGLSVIIYLLGFSLQSFGQQFNFHNISEASSSQCYCVLQDSKGYIWFSSEKGLYRYDGNTYKYFNNDNGLLHNSVFQLFEDHEGRILFNTMQGSIGYVYHDSVIYPKLNQKLVLWLHHGAYLIYSLYVDDRGVLWIPTYHGLYKTVKPNDYSDVEPVKPNDADSSHVILSIIGGKKAVYVLNEAKYKQNDKGIRFHILVNNGVKSFTIPYFIDVKGENASQFSTFLLNNGVLLWCNIDKLYIIQPDGKYTVKNIGGKVISMYQDKNGGVWFGFLHKGLVYYKDASLTGPPLISLQDVSVSGIIEDNENGIWVSTLEKGVFHANSKYIIDYSNKEGLNGKIGAITILNNKLLVNNYKNFISVVSDTGSVKMVPSDSCKIELVSGYNQFNDKLFITGMPYVLQTDTLLKKWRILCQINRRLRVYLNNISILPKGEIYGVSYTHIWSAVRDSIDTISKLPARGRCIFVSKSGEILIGTTKGLYRYINNEYINISQNNDLSFQNGQKFGEDQNGNIWVTTYGNGIYVYNNDKIIKTISTKDGLASNYVKAIVFDSAGNAWAGTDNGLSKISLAENKCFIQNFDERHGLISKQIVSLAIKGNKLWAGTDVGLCLINTDQLKSNNSLPPVFISAIYVNDSLIKNTGQLPYNFNNFRFRLQGLTFKDNKTRFKYRLIGSDTNWSISESPDVIITNIPPGSYSFEAKAINADGVASDKAAVFLFTVLNPFWRTWWFILMEILTVGGLITFFVRLRLNVIKRREEEKAGIHKMITEYQMTALRAQMNPHFVFNAINSIQDFVLDSKPKQAYDYLTSFASLIRMVLNNAKEKSVSLETELETLGVYIKLEQLRFSNKFDFVLEVDENVDQYNIHLPAMIIQPYIENAIWHGLMPLGNLRKGVLKLSIREDADTLIINVEDNGIGFAKSSLIKKTKEHKSIGMDLTEQRLGMLKNLPEYASSSVTLNHLQDENGNSAGTRVEIRIVNKTS
jgi:ligand-binding sensor domain-containing protein